MAQKLSFYCELPTIFELMERYGERLEDMNFNSLLTFRAVVDLFVLYYSRDLAGSVEQNFDLAVENCYPDWGQEDEESYTLCRGASQFCKKVREQGVYSRVFFANKWGDADVAITATI